MKTLSQNTQQPKWDSKLLQDLSFIRQHSRYPFVQRHIWPLLFYMLCITFYCFIFMLNVYSNKRMSQLAFTRYVIPALFICLFIGAILNYLRSLRFVNIPTFYDSTANQQLIESFLGAMQLAIYRHPQAQEVFQILSRNVSPRVSRREVIIFIADDRRILLNSHFSGSWFGLTQQRHHREMASLLQKWIKEHPITSTDTSIISNSTF